MRHPPFHNKSKSSANGKSPLKSDNDQSITHLHDSVGFNLEHAHAHIKEAHRNMKRMKKHLEKNPDLERHIKLLSGMR